MKITRKQENKYSLPTDPQVIEEYIWVINKIERERQRTPDKEAILYPIPEDPFVATGVPSTEQENLILGRLGQIGIIVIIKKPVYTGIEGVWLSDRVVEIPDLNRFLGYREQLLKQKKLYLESANQNKKEPAVLPKFHFNQGVLFRDFCNEILMVKGENTQEYRLLNTAIALPVRERIDELTEDLEMNWRQIYDTGRRLNDKIKDIFKIDNFFQIDFENKKLHRTVD